MTDATQINVRLLFFGAAREAAGCSEEELTVHAPATAASVFTEVLARHPALQRFGRALLVAVNEEYAGMDAPISAHDEVAIFPPVLSPRTQSTASPSVAPAMYREENICTTGFGTAGRRRTSAESSSDTGAAILCRDGSRPCV